MSNHAPGCNSEICVCPDVTDQVLIMWSSRWSLIWLLFLVSAVLCPTAKACFQYSSSLSNPCLDKDCSFGAECIPTLNGHTAECVCPAKCPSYGDSRDSRPICGSDGHDYVNLCELNRHACSLVKSVSVRYNGSCGNALHWQF